MPLNPKQANRGSRRRRPNGPIYPLAIDYSLICDDLDRLSEPIELGEAYLAGAGAIGNGFLWATRHESVYLIKPNLRELSEFVGATLVDDDDCIIAARRLIALGHVEIIALTLGHRGALLITHDQAWRASPLPIAPISIVGAGDSFLGGMVSGLAAGQDLERAFRLGVAAGSAAVLAPGTRLCQRKDIDRLYPQVTIKPV